MDAGTAATDSARTFLLSDTHPYDWMTAGQNNNLWSTIEDEKGPYDPCPFGWRVPPAPTPEASPWHGFANGANSMSLPAAGGISGETGDPIGTPRALVWGASARGTDAYLYDATGKTHTQAHRTDAYPIRCIRDVRYPGGSLIVGQ
jgi:hypothetical protein